MVEVKELRGGEYVFGRVKKCVERTRQWRFPDVEVYKRTIGMLSLDKIWSRKKWCETPW